MVNVEMLNKCEFCKDYAKINKVFIEEKSEETYLVKEYLCDCGHFTRYKEVINYVIKK